MGENLESGQAVASGLARFINRARWFSRPGSASAPLVLLFVALLLAGAVLSAVIPPLQSPDECDHLKRAYLLTRGVLLLEAPPGHGSGGMVDDGLLAFIDHHLFLPYQQNHIMTRSIDAKAAGMAWAGQRSFTSAPGAGYYFPLVYTPQALGLALGEMLDLTIHHSYQLARLFCLAASLLLIFLAFRLHPTNFFVVGLLLLPMSVFQFVSTTIDGFTTALTVLAISLFLRGLDQQKRFPPWMSFSLAAAAFILATSRAHLLPLTLLPLACFFVRRSKRDLWLCLAVTALALTWTAVALAHTVDLRQAREAGTGQIALYYLGRPGEFFGVLGATLAKPDLLDFYRQSFIGILGWLDTNLSAGYYNAASAVLIGLGLVSVSFKGLRADLWPRLVLLALSVISVLLIYLALLLAWSPHPARFIVGIQGRYFIAPALLLGYALSGRSNVFEARRASLMAPLMYAWFVFSAYYMSHALIIRFYAIRG